MAWSKLLNSEFISVLLCYYYHCAKSVNGKGAKVWNSHLISLIIIVNIQNYSCLFSNGYFVKDI